MVNIAKKSLINFLILISVTLCSTSFASFDTSNLVQPKPNPKVYALALKAYNDAKTRGIKDPKHLLTIVDFSLPSSEQRMWVVDVKNDNVLFHTLVAHGMTTGLNKAKYFSDNFNTHASSIGLYQTQNTYIGHHGYSLVINGLDRGFNDNAKARHIVVHAAYYVTPDFVKKYGRIGRSWGCLALNPKTAKQVINTIKGGTLIFAYYPNQKWLASSEFLHGQADKA